MKTVWIYVDTSKDARDADHLKVFENMYIADRWLEANEPEGVAFEYPVIRSVPPSSVPPSSARNKNARPVSQPGKSLLGSLRSEQRTIHSAALAGRGRR